MPYDGGMIITTPTKLLRHRKITYYPKEEKKKAIITGVREVIE
jgi:hypothetical protein